MVSCMCDCAGGSSGTSCESECIVKKGAQYNLDGL